jgi:hypothetical protein
VAFQDVNSNTKFKKLTELAVGESLTGYPVGITESTKIVGALNLLMNIDGERISVSVAGNVKYMLKDNKINMGQLTRITRLEDSSVKGKKSTKFKVEQDPESVLEGIQATPPPPTKTSMSDKLAALKG